MAATGNTASAPQTHTHTRHPQRRKPARRRIAAAAATAAALALTTTACGSGKKGGLFEDKVTSGPGTGGGSGGANGKKGALEDLLVKQADLPAELNLAAGTISVLNGRNWQPSTEIEARDPRCQPLFDMIDPDHATTRPTAAASVYIAGRLYPMSANIQEYPAGTTPQLLASIADAVTPCRTTEARIGGGPWTKVETLDNMLPTVGDGAAGYQLRWGDKGKRTYATVSVVRVGDRLVTTLAQDADSTEDRGPQPDFGLLRAQVKKLTGRD
ncbi:hypothetical protein [Yinghuangia soli]|uniref:PknH-like extracellular domain-containing protein n=1 Tax=Yinghuangia soli TaxID=2908204 RepID=A0AA41Q6N4_9ACTN|nr:hypothetical protein [Yinghuangia soli]MCF2532241.1 hypothetical protein [Yinghuangia soli]